MTHAICVGRVDCLDPVCASNRRWSWQKFPHNKTGYICHKSGADAAFSNSIGPSYS